MSKNTSIAFIINVSTQKELKRFMSNNFFLIKKMDDYFKKVYIFNLNNLTFFNKSKNFLINNLNDLHLPKSVNIFYPKDLNEFNKFTKNMKILGINFISTNEFSIIKILLLMKINNIKLIEISNVGNVQISVGNASFHGIYKKYLHKLIVLLSNFSFLPKIEIKFITNFKLHPNNINKSIYQKFFNYFQFSLAKKTVLINSRSYDIFKENTFKKSEKYIVLLEELLNHSGWTRYGRKQFSKNQLKIHYDKLNKKLKYLSLIYKKKIIICLHPDDNIRLKKKYFKSFSVVQYKTREYIYKSFIVLFFESSAIIDAILLNKTILSINSEILDINQKIANHRYVKDLGLTVLDIDKNDKRIKINKKLMFKKYSYFLNKYITPDKSKDLGYKKVINTIKKLLINEN